MEIAEIKKNGIEKHNIPIKKHPTMTDWSVKDIIKIALEQPPQSGFTTSEMRKRLKILDKLDALNADSTVIELDPDEVATIVEGMARVQWTKLDRFIIDFEDSLK